MAESINLSGPDITDAEIDAVVAVLRTPSLSLGPKVPEFERQFTERLGARHAIACNSGTSGLHLIWRALDVVDGAEVVTTPFSFIASSNSIMFTGAKPVFVDIDADTWQIDAKLVEGAVTANTRAILPVDVFGSVPDMAAINAIAARRNLRVVEDSCEALGTKLSGKPAGMLGEVGIFGFYPNKQITTGEGGMIVTNDDEVAFRCRSLRNQGRDPDAGWLQHARLGYNYRLCDINCALGVVQMSRLDEIVARRAQVARWYLDRLAGEERIATQKLPTGLDMSWFVFVVRLSDTYSQTDRDTILEKLRERGVGCSNYFTPIHLQPFYQRDLGYGPGDFPITEALSARTVALPFHNGLSEADVDRVVKEFRAAL